VSFDAFLDYAAFVAALTAVAIAIYIARNKAVLENYRVTVESQNVRLNAQASEIGELSRRMDEVSVELAATRNGYEFAMTVFATAVANAGICAVAWDCSNRVLPETVESKPRTHKVSRVKAEVTD
jgi:uncharacterized membrane protein